MRKQIILLYSIVNTTILFCAETSGSLAQLPLAIIVVGASCSGKSTLVKELCRRHNFFANIDIDQIEDNLIAQKIGCDPLDKKRINAARIHIDPETLLAHVTKHATEHLNRGDSIVIDSNLIETVNIPLTTKNKIRVLISCPLELLIQRDRLRNHDITRHRDSTRAKRAREFVESTFETFASAKQHFYDVYIDSSTLSINESVETIIRNSFEMS